MYAYKNIQPHEKNEHILNCATRNLDTHKNLKCIRLSILKSLKLQRQNKGRAKDNGCYISVIS